MKKYKSEELFPPSKYVLHQHVAVFDEHTREGKAGKKPSKITKEDLEKLATNCNKKFTDLGLGTPLAIGHTKDEADEEDQPEIIGFSNNFKVDKLGNTNRYGLFCDWYIKKKFEDAVDRYPHRSIELYMDRYDINPISLLATAPDRDLPVIRYSKDTNELPYRYVYSPTPWPSPNSENHIMNENEKVKVADAVAGESSSDKQLATEVAGLKEQLSQLTSMFQELMQMVTSEDGNDNDSEGDRSQADLLDQVDDDKAGDDEKEDSEGVDDQDKEGDKVEEAVTKAKPEKKAADGEAEQYSAAAGPNNTYIPTEKTRMSRKTYSEEEVAQFARKVAKEATDAVLKENEDLRYKFNRSEAEKAVAVLENDSNIDFGSKEDREEEVALLTDLLGYDKEGKSFKTHLNKIVRKYKRKEPQKPNSEGVASVMRFSRTPSDDKPAFSGTDDVIAFVNAHNDDPTLTPEAWAAKRSGKK